MTRPSEESTHFPARILIDEREEPSASLYKDVYNEHFGVPDDRWTIEQLREQFNSISNYLEERKKGNVDLNFGDSEGNAVDVEEIKREAREEGFREGYSKGYQDALEAGSD